MTAKVERRRRKEERPGEILDAAFEEFSLNGFAGTRLDDVAARAGITKGTIYLYFAGKEDLFAAMVREMCRPAKEHLMAAAASPRGSALDILRSHLDVVWSRMVQDRRGRELVRMIVAEGSRFPDLVDRWHAEVMEPSSEGLRTILLYGQARGEFHPSAVADFSQLVMAPVIMTCVWLSIFGDRQPLDLDAMFEAAVDLLARGLVARVE